MKIIILLIPDPKPVNVEKLPKIFVGFNKKQLAEKTCKYGHKFMPISTFQKCNITDCAIRQAKDKVAAEEAKAIRKGLVNQKKAYHLKYDTDTDYKKKLETVINAIVREIDKGCNCISCKEGTIIKKIFAGHLHSVGSNDTLRFNLHNEHSQCYSCNGNKGGQNIMYLAGLRRIYGIEYANYVEMEVVALYPILDLTKQQLTEATKLAKEILKSLIASNEFRIESRTPEQRIILRNEINNSIGFYQDKFKELK